MTVRLRSRKPYFSAWVPVTGAALALLLCAGFIVLAVLQADKSWTFIMLAILCFLIAGYVLLSAALNKGLTDCVLLSETGATVRRAFKKSVFYPYEQLEVAFGKVDGRDCFLFLVKEEAGDREELLDVSYPVIKGAKHFLRFTANSARCFSNGSAFPFREKDRIDLPCRRGISAAAFSLFFHLRGEEGGQGSARPGRISPKKRKKEKTYGTICHQAFIGAILPSGATFAGDGGIIRALLGGRARFF